jgi:hypothetical protein
LWGRARHFLDLRHELCPFGHMRDPLRPIPAPSSTSYWDACAPPPAPASRPQVQPDDRQFDPMGLIRDRENDSLGLDRRATRRRTPQQDDPALLASEGRGQALVRAAHEAMEGMLALCTSAGWALVQTLTLSPQGLLLRHVDALDRDLQPETRVQMSRALRSLSPVLGAPERELRRGGSSPLANLGTHLLGARVVADAASWSHAGNAHPRARTSLEVSLLLPPRTVGTGVSRLTNAAQLPRFEGRLSSLNDPDPRVLAVALERRAVDALRLQLRGHRAG